jgi:hypothetical protein
MKRIAAFVLLVVLLFSVAAAEDVYICAEGGKYKITEGKAILVGPESKKTKTITMPAAITGRIGYGRVVEIAPNAFKGNKYLEEITIGIEVTTIGKNAFKDCKNLKTIHIKTTRLTEVGKNAFKGTPKTVTVDFRGKKDEYIKLLKKKGLVIQEEVSLKDAKFIGNKATSVFHRPTCRMIKKMLDENKIGFMTREEAIKLKYKPCGICHP